MNRSEKELRLIDELESVGFSEISMESKFVNMKKQIGQEHEMFVKFEESGSENHESSSGRVIFHKKISEIRIAYTSSNLKYIEEIMDYTRIMSTEIEKIYTWLIQNNLVKDGMTIHEHKYAGEKLFPDEERYMFLFRYGYNFYYYNFDIRDEEIVRISQTRSV